MKKSVQVPTTATPPSQLHDHLFPVLAGNLHADITEGDLGTLFSTIGPVHSVRLCRNRYTGKSLCFGYINFYSFANAVAAFRDLNDKNLRGKPLRMTWLEKDPAIRNNAIGKLFVKNLDLKVNEGKLEEIFGVFGWILSCNICRDDEGNSKGFGFVQFSSEEAALNALSALNGSVCEGKTLTVAKYLKKVERNEVQFTNVYVENLDESFTECSLKEKFSEIGKVTSAVIMNDEQGKSRGFGYVTFQSHENAAKAIETLNAAQMGTKKLFVGKAMMKAQTDASLGRAHQEETPKVSNMFVRNLATSVTEKDLKQVCGAFGSLSLANKPWELMKPRALLVKEDSFDREKVSLGRADVSNLFVRNLATSVTEKDLKQVCGALGSLSLANKPRTLMLPRPIMLKQGSAEHEKVFKEFCSSRQNKNSRKRGGEPNWDESFCLKTPKRGKK